ncbi:3-oxo-5-alpha-steroid 4-dehydrogenase-domain-containing protein [Lipomyces oligophaga]|uniref:3-oxo-5-alpha-steroid 4-dehydrogenase-domain-containing protein n=1 Tax=Lipomyces oligophaga TaxID=45792 RepID=UPI0034D003DA
MVHVLLRQPATARLPISNLPDAIEVDRDHGLVDDLLHAIQKSTNLARNRLKLFLVSSNISLDPQSPLKVYDMKDGTRVVVKDLGPQIGRRTLLLTAYSGPVFIHVICYYCQSLVYGCSFEHSASQVLAFTLICLHFAKRMFETLFVHVFYQFSVSLYSVYIYLFHYWFLSGLFMAYYVYYPTEVSSTAPSASSSAPGACSSTYVLPFSPSPEAEETSLYFLSAIWIFAELSNFETHIILAKLRLRYPRTTTFAQMPFNSSRLNRHSRARLLLPQSAISSTSPEHHDSLSSATSSFLAAQAFPSPSSFSRTCHPSRRIPKGYGFDWVSCPNYFFELIAWMQITLITRSLVSLLFLVASALQMWRKAARKHELYKKEFGAQYPKYRKILIPYVK